MIQTKASSIMSNSNTFSQNSSNVLDANNFLLTPWPHWKILFQRKAKSSSCCGILQQSSKNSLPSSGISNDASDIKNDISSNDKRNAACDCEDCKEREMPNRGSMGDSLIEVETDDSAEIPELKGSKVFDDKSHSDSWMKYSRLSEGVFQQSD